jgi:hypothetical protein
MEIIIDDQPNALIYSSCIKGSQLFGEYANTLYPLKVKKLHYSKLLLNIIWCSLVERNKTKKSDFSRNTVLDSGEFNNI